MDQKAGLRSCLALSLTLSLGLAHAADGLIAVRSANNVEQTVQRLEQAIKDKGANLIASVDHAHAASKVGMKLRPTRVAIFGNPKGGTPLMQCAQTMGIDLPQKMLVYEDETGQTWVAYNDMRHFAKRHGMKQCDDAIENNAKALKAIAAQAAGVAS